MKKILSFIQKNSVLSSVVGSAIFTGLLKLADLILKLNLRIIDFVFLFLLLLNFIFLIIVYRKQRRIPASGDEGQLRTDFENHKKAIENVLSDMDERIGKNMQSISQIYDKAKRYEEKETEERIIFILETIGANLDRRIFKGRLLSLYKKKFNFESRKELILSFNMNSTLLKKRNLIIPVTMARSIFYAITNKGLEYLRLARIKIEEEKGENSK